MNIGAGHYVVLSAMIFGIGLVGVVIRRALVAQLSALLVMLTAPVIAFAGFARTVPTPPGSNSGAAVGLVALGAALGEVAVGAALLLLMQRRGLCLDLEHDHDHDHAHVQTGARPDGEGT